MVVVVVAAAVVGAVDRAELGTAEDAAADNTVGLILASRLAHFASRWSDLVGVLGEAVVIDTW